MLLDVPDSFFTVTFPMLGILLSISKKFVRVRMEERSWEQRLIDARLELMKRDPSLTELDSRRNEAALEWSAYGTPRLLQQQQQNAYDNEYNEDNRRTGTKRQRVQVMDRPDDYDVSDYDDNDDNDTTPASSYPRMSDSEIRAFEKEYGVEYDPYYDEPYTSTELPNDINYSTDRMYGDRIYENGEIFYKDSKTTNLYWRQGSKPRTNNILFWGK
jgi:hypothetical protein